MTIISDATSLILLAKVGLLEFFVSRNRVMAPTVVYGEVMKGKEKGREDSLLIERLRAEKRLQVKSPRKAARNSIQRLFNLKGGELDVIALAAGTQHTVLTDDRKCLNSAKALGIEFVTSLDVVVTLYKKGAIPKERALECINRLEEYGWYSRDPIKYYREMVK
ncbi:MAG: hypothetical protein HY731_02195 [Candidatus Tectomicrobia bacterium]|nr:hypothetical protein [Candidatus Tectomicrobia bacterium]